MPLSTANLRSRATVQVLSGRAERSTERAAERDRPRFWPARDPERPRVDAATGFGDEAGWAAAAGFGETALCFWLATGPGVAGSGDASAVLGPGVLAPGVLAGVAEVRDALAIVGCGVDASGFSAARR